MVKLTKFGVQSVPAYGQMKPNRCLGGWEGVADLKKSNKKDGSIFVATYVKLKSWSNLTKFGVQSFPAYGQMKLNSWLEGWEGFADLKKVKQKRWQHFCGNLCKVEKLVKSDQVWGSINSSIWSDEA